MPSITRAKSLSLKRTKSFKKILNVFKKTNVPVVIPIIDLEPDPVTNPVPSQRIIVEISSGSLLDDPDIKKFILLD